MRNKDWEKVAYHNLAYGLVTDAILLGQGFVRAGLHEDFISKVFFDYGAIERLKKKFSNEFEAPQLWRLFDAYCGCARL